LTVKDNTEPQQLNIASVEIKAEAAPDLVVSALTPAIIKHPGEKSVDGDD